MVKQAIPIAKSQDYIIEQIWADWWQGKSDDGLSYPEASYKHHILTKWAEENCQNTVKSTGELKYQFRNDYKKLIKNWDFNDDENGNWTIITDETTYHFRLQNGKWLMIDSNGTVIDSFMSFSTLENNAVTETNSFIEDKISNRRVGEWITLETTAIAEMPTEIEISIQNNSYSNYFIYDILITAVVGMIILAGIFFRKKRG